MPLNTIAGLYQHLAERALLLLFYQRHLSLPLWVSEGYSGSRLRQTSASS